MAGPKDPGALVRMYATARKSEGVAMRFRHGVVVGAVVALVALSGCGGDDEARSDGDAVSGPLQLTAAQLEDLLPSSEVAGELMGAREIHADSDVLMMVELPPGGATHG